MRKSRENRLKKPASFVRTSFGLLVVAATSSLGVVASGTAASADPAPLTVATGFQPADLVVNVGADATQMSITWFSAAGSGTPQVRVGSKAPVSGTDGAVATDSSRRWNKVTVTGLVPGTTYTFTVSDDGVDYSQQYSFTTAGSGAFSFAAVGDPQIGSASPTDSPASIAAASASWSATVAEIQAKGASFVVGTGDQIENAGQSAADVAVKGQEYTGFLAGLDQGGSMVPFAPALGNHEGDGSSTTIVGRGLYGEHYDAPHQMTDVVNGLPLQDYFYTVNGVLYVVLDTAAYPSDAAAAAPYVSAFDHTLATATSTYAGKYSWLVVQTHKSQMSNASHWNDTDIRAYSQAGFEDLMTKYGVDLALTGHDHAYTRTYPLKSSYTTVGTGGPLVADGVTADPNNTGDVLEDPDGTVYMVLDSATGSKYYSLHQPPKATSKVEYQGNVPEYTMVDVTSGSLTVTTYEVGNSKVVDRFTIDKTAPTPENAITVTSVATSGNGQADVCFPIRSANGKGYTVLVSTTGAPGSFTVADANFNSKGAHVKGLKAGTTYYVYVQYADSTTTERSDVVTVVVPAK